MELMSKGVATPSDLSIFVKLKRLVSAHFYSYGAHLLRHESYDPELHFGKVWAGRWESLRWLKKVLRFRKLQTLRFSSQGHPQTF